MIDFGAVRSFVVFAVVGAVLVPTLAGVAAISGASSSWPLLAIQIAAALAAALAVGVCIWRVVADGGKPAWSNALLGGALAVAAAWTAPDASRAAAQLRNAEAIPTFDLTEGPLPAHATGTVTVRGHLRGEMVLDEYRVTEGARPNQNETAPARLVPLLGSPESEAVLATGRIVVARVPGDTEIGGEARSFTGTLDTLPPGTFESLFAVAEDVDLERLDGVMLDTRAVPTAETVWTHLALVIGAGLLGAFLLWGAATPRDSITEE